MTIENPVPQGEVLQLTPYNAKYDAGPTLLPGHMTKMAEGKEIRTMFSDTFKSLIDADLPRLLSMKTVPSEITAEDVKTWLGSTLMRYHEEPSEVLPATVKELREKALKLSSKENVSLLTSLIDTLEMPWGYDDFGKQQQLRNIWEQQLNSALKSQACAEDVLNKVQHFGGFFALGSSVNQISGFIEILVHSEIGQVDSELSTGSVEFRERVERCDTYADRLVLLKAHRAKLLSFLQDYISAQLALLEQQRAKVNAELNEMLISLGRRPRENADSAELPPDMP